MVKKLYVSILLTLLILSGSTQAQAQDSSLLPFLDLDKNMQMFREAVAIADLDSFFENAGTYTILVPLDDAFAKMPAGAFDTLKQNTTHMRQLVLSHVILHVVSADQLANTPSLKTAAGMQFPVTVGEETIIINQNAQVEEADVAAAYSLVHKIDTVLIPPNLQQVIQAPPQTDSSASLTGTDGTVAEQVEEIATPEPTATPEPEFGVPPLPTFVLLTVPVLNPAYLSGGNLPYWSGVQSNSTSCKGMSWVLYRNVDGVVQVGADAKTNPYRGDTHCSESLPLLCLKRDGSTPPPSSSGYNYSRGWAAGEAKITAPLSGEKLSSLPEANRACTEVFGSGWRMAEFHDGDNGNGGWRFWAYGGLPLRTRFWVYIDDQFANPWNSYQPRAGSPSVGSGSILREPAQNPAYKPGAYLTREEGVRAGGCRGTTWTLLKQDEGVSLVGGDSRTNPYRGDASCQQQHPVLCIKVDGFGPPPNRGGNLYSVNWSGAQIKATSPVGGGQLNSRAKAAQLCSSTFRRGLAYGLYA